MRSTCMAPSSKRAGHLGLAFMSQVKIMMIHQVTYYECREVRRFLHAGMDTLGIIDIFQVKMKSISSDESPPSGETLRSPRVITYERSASPHHLQMRKIQIADIGTLGGLPSQSFNLHSERKKLNRRHFHKENDL